MSFPRSYSFALAVVCLFTFQFVSPTQSHADSYSLVGLGIDNVAFYGLSDTGAVVFTTYANAPSCTTACYGHPLGAEGPPTWSTTVPSLTWDNGSAACSGIPASALEFVCNSGRATFYQWDPSHLIQQLYVLNLGSSIPQLLYTSGFSGHLYMNSLGDIVFDDGRLDEWDEAINLTSRATPEPASFALLAIGLAGGGLLFGRRRLQREALFF